MSLKLFKVDRPTHFKSAWFPRSYFVGGDGWWRVAFFMIRKELIWVGKTFFHSAPLQQKRQAAEQPVSSPSISFESPRDSPDRWHPALQSPPSEGRANRRFWPRPLGRKKPARPFKKAPQPQLPSEADSLLPFTRQCLLPFACEPQARRGARFSHRRMTDFSRGLPSAGGEAPGQGELSARGARIAEGCVGLLDRGLDRYLDDPFDADQNPQVTATFRPAPGDLQDFLGYLRRIIASWAGGGGIKVVFGNGWMIFKWISFFSD